MVQQTIDSKFSEYGPGSTESELPVQNKQPSVLVKKAVLRDLKNVNNVVPNIGNPSVSKDTEPLNDAPRVTGTKQPLPECPMTPPQHQSPSSSAANAQLVYVRRKAEADVVRSITCDNASINADCQVTSKVSHHEASTRPMSETKETEVHCFPAFAPFAVAAPSIPSGKPSVSVPHCNSDVRVATAGSNCHPLSSATPTLEGSKGPRNMHWEERCHQLQLLLMKLDQSVREDYLQMLRSLSSVELSRHAVELEKRSIQLSLEEVKEMQRVRHLNVLGRPVDLFKVPSTHQDQPEK